MDFAGGPTGDFAGGSYGGFRGTSLVDLAAHPQ